MSKDRIKSIELKHFRGATQPLQLDFEPKKSMVMIFGENGTGKSTIIDAIDFVFNRQCGSLKEKSSTKVNRHLPSLHSKSSQVEVSVKSQKGLEWRGRLIGSKPEITGSQESLSVRILRRDKVLKLINAEPNKRYEALKDFIDLPGIRSSEKSLRELIKDIKQQLNQNIETKQEKETGLKDIWNKETEKKTSLEKEKSWRKIEKRGDEKVEEKEKDIEGGQSEIHFMEWVKGMSQKQDQELIQRITQQRKLIECIKKPLECFDELKNLREEWEELRKKLEVSKKHLKTLTIQNQPEEVIDILQKTREFLQKKETTKECPACEQPIVPKELQKRITDRLKNMQAFIDAKNQIQKAEKAYEFTQKNLSETEKELFQLTNNLMEYSTKENSPSESKQLKIIFTENNFLANGSIQLEQAKVFFEHAESFMQQVISICESDQKTLNQLNFIKNLYSSLKKTDNEIKELDRKEKYLSEILKMIETERKTYVEKLLGEISSDIETLYIKLHPDEGLNNIQLFLNPKRQASLEIKSNFQSKEDVPPQAYFSDSHLDTLGICVFIAMAKYFKDDIIVLDDVVTSLDGQHLNRFIQMLDAENQNFSQIILSTHYRPWRDKYKSHRWPNSNIHLMELFPFWSLAEGIKSHQTKLSIEELEAFKTNRPFDRQAASSKAGVFFRKFARPPGPYLQVSSSKERRS